MYHKKLIKIYSKKYLEGILEKYEKYRDVRSVINDVNEIIGNYKLLDNNYRNEYFYKNNLFNKIVLGRHNLNTSYALNEVVINKSKADMIIVNNERPIVFEIKTELDNFDKLEHQINDYYKISSKVFVVTAESSFYPLYRILKNSDVGIYVLSKRNTLSLKKEAHENLGRLDHITLFKLLRKYEYENIIMGYFGFTPVVSAFEYYTECLSLFHQIEIVNAQKLVFMEIKKRGTNFEKKYIYSIPYEIRWLVYSSKFNEIAYENLVSIFKG